MGSESGTEEAAAGAGVAALEIRDPDPRRLCARVGCACEAVATLTADYEGRQMAVGPLSPEPQPPAHDLCARHLEALTAPEGWELLRHDDSREAQRG